MTQLRPMRSAAWRSCSLVQSVL